ncbi:MAG: hydroxyectoine utilization dehydratase EutB [Gammaproteobacteria bacterium]|nr:hydroxyectoine utilization dehydratase EutB [Gammaproteobacteria bacterium]MDH3447623.1 hydroxyectoine utilization dehydratase EutB [Gammaproteobacteria bacterium]
MSRKEISLSDIRAAWARIAPHIVPLHIAPSSSLSQHFGKDIMLAHEYLQTTGAFKLRGAMNSVLQLDAATTGVTAVSTGNHGRALAYSARQAGVPCIICMSELVPQNKLEAIRALGAETRIVGKSQDEAEIEARRLVAEEGFTMIPPFEHPHVIAGQGTLGLEMLEQLPDLDTVLVQLSGGGLISGIALAIKSQKPGVRVIGISMERGCAMYASQQAGKPVEVEELPTLADSLGGGIGLDNRLTFDIVHDYVDELVLLSEDEIAEGIRYAYCREQVILEGGGAVGIAALLAGKVTPGDRTVVLLSGKNIDMGLHRQIINREEYRL